MKISKNGIEFIRRWEGVRLRAYQDTGGVWTIGVGHTSMAGKPEVTPNLTITLEQADEILARDLAKTEAAVNQYVKVPLSQNQYDVLVSFTFNCGIGGFKRSTLLKRLNAGKYTEAADQLLKWVNDNGRRIQGLVNRRQAERDLFLSSETVPVKKGGDPVSPVPEGKTEPVAQETPKKREFWLIAILKGILNVIKVVFMAKR